MTVLNCDILRLILRPPDWRANRNESLLSLGTWECKYCGHLNSKTMLHCKSCWTAIYRDDAEIVARKGFIKSEVKVKRVTYSVLLLLLGWFIALWVWSNVVHQTTFADIPASMISSVSGPGEWAVFQHNLQHTGTVEGVAFSFPQDVEWRFDTERPIETVPVVVGEKLFVSTGDRGILALDANNGDALWNYYVEGPVSSTPAVADDRVFVGLRNSEFIAIDASNGKLIWTFDTDNIITASPVVDRGVVYIGSGDKNLYALDAITGQERWRSHLYGWISASPTIVEEVVIVPSTDRKLFFLDRSSGKLRQAYAGIATSSPVASPIWGDDVIFADGSGVLRSIDWRLEEYPFEKSIFKWKANAYLWKIRKDAPIQKGYNWGYRIPRVENLPRGRFIGAPAVSDGIVFVGDTNGKLHTFRVEDGIAGWSYESKSAIEASVIVVGDVVLFGCRDGKLYGLSKESGELVWQFDIGEPIATGPIFANDMLYVTSKSGSIYALN